MPQVGPVTVGLIVGIDGSPGATGQQGMQGEDGEDGLTIPPSSIDTSFDFDKVLTDSIAVITNNWNPTQGGKTLNDVSVVRASTDSELHYLTGLAAPTDPGKLLIIPNIGNRNLFLQHDDAGSVAANRFYCPNGQRYALRPFEATWLWYDNISLRWQVIATLERFFAVPTVTYGVPASGVAETTLRSDAILPLPPSNLMPGVPGEDGEDGLIVPGPTGTAGAGGATGNSGPAGIGIPGLDGEDGESAYSIPGTQGIAGIAGATGSNGPIGYGLDGNDGEDGLVIPGPIGATGAAGAAGATGTSAILGLNGDDGEDGLVIPGPAGAASSAASSGIIALHIYAPSVQTIYSATSTTHVDVDATNLAITFTTPASGNVLVTLSAYADMGITDSFQWSLREGSSDIANSNVVVLRANGIAYVVARFYLSGLSAGNHTLKWAFSGPGGAVNGRIIIQDGPVNTSQNKWGPAIMTVEAAP